MLIKFTDLQTKTVQNFYDGQGEVYTRSYLDKNTVIMFTNIPCGSSIGLHSHLTSCEYVIAISGQGTVICDGETEHIEAGCCHYCPECSEHEIVNTGNETLSLYMIVTERN